MERYHMYRLGIAILFYAIYCGRPMVVNGLEVDDSIGALNNKTASLKDNYLNYLHGVQGRPGVDYPIYKRIPRTKFSCKEVESGYYADLDTNCQVFHICNEGKKISFLCPNGTIFQQSDLICDWWFKVNCTNSPNLYEESAEMLRESQIRRKASRRVLNRGEVTFTSSEQGPKIGRRNMDVRSSKNRYNSEEETQMAQETASFFGSGSSRNSLHPNHRTTYSDIQDAQKFVTSSIRPVIRKNSFNNGQPFVVSTPKLGSFATERNTFFYSPTIPTTQKPATTTTPTRVAAQNAFYGDKIGKDSSQYVQISTRLKTVNSKSIEGTTEKNVIKNRGRTSYTLGLNSAQGSMPVYGRQEAQKSSYRQGKSSNRIKLNLSTNQGSKLFNTKNSDYPKKPITSLENEIPEFTTARNGFYITKSNPVEKESTDFKLGSNTGSKNTYIPTTQSSIITNIPHTTEYITNTFGFVKPTGTHKPKPFELPSSTATPPDLTDQTTLRDYQKFPNYQTSSARPFTNVPPTLPTRYQLTTVKSYYSPTLPTIYTSARPFSTAIPAKMSENVNKMLETIKDLAQDLNNPRPGLIVPPSVGPQTLHTLAVYFANALDGLAPPNMTQENVLTAEPHEHNSIINSLLSTQTIHGYNELFNSQEGDKTDAKTTLSPVNDDYGQEDESDDLLGGHSINAVQSPRVRQLAKVFTQALSSYLENPDMFRKVLQEIRPTEPPVLGTTSEAPIEEDELLNFSDADIKPENPRLPTPVPVNPTWGYILSSNNSDVKHNSLENLQSSDSQSFIPSYNNEVVNRVKDLPTNHWTTSADVTKLWRSTLQVNPESINQNFGTTRTPDVSYSSGEDFDNFIDRTTEEDKSADLSEFATESIIDYELRALPKINLNSTEVHGLLIDYMNSTRNDDNNKLHRILNKLNTTEEQFLEKMKEIEQNPLTKRLILLLINECGKEKSFETKASAVRDIINLGGSGTEITQSTNVVKKEASGFTKLVDQGLKDEDHDSRALQLLNSLYSIASRYGK